MTEIRIKTMWNQTLALDFKGAKMYKAYLERETDQFSKVLNSYPKNAIGLTPDHIKATTEWQANYHWYHVWHKRLQSFNRTFTKTFKKELPAERKARNAG